MDDNILPFFELLVLTAADYKAALRSSVAAGLVGGVVFDALHLHCAQKADCDRVYTFNLKDFLALATDSMRSKIATP